MKKRNYGLLVNFTYDETVRLDRLCSDNGFIIRLKGRSNKPNRSAFIRFKLFYDNPVFNIKAMAAIERFILNRQYQRLNRFLKSVRNGDANG